jgi:hypothetical protein
MKRQFLLRAASVASLALAAWYETFAGGGKGQR